MGADGYPTLPNEPAFGPLPTELVVEKDKDPKLLLDAGTGVGRFMSNEEAALDGGRKYKLGDGPYPNGLPAPGAIMCVSSGSPRTSNSVARFIISASPLIEMQ